MVFAIEMDTGALWSFPTTEAAMSQCERYDVVDGGWKFFADDGAELVPQFEPVKRLFGIKVYEPGYDLNESMLSGGPNLRTHLATIRYVESDTFSSVAEVESYLEQHSRRSKE